MKQETFASLAWSSKGRTTRRERFLAEMNAVVPWARLLTLIAPHYPTGAGGRSPMPLERMLRIYFMQQWFNQSDPGMEDALYDSESMRRFAGIELSEDAIPDETTIDPALSALAREAQADGADLCRSAAVAGGEEAAAQVGDHRGRDDHQRPQLDEERRQEPRSGNAPRQEEQAGVEIRDEGPCRHQ